MSHFYTFSFYSPFSFSLNHVSPVTQSYRKTKLSLYEYCTLKYSNALFTFKGFSIFPLLQLQVNLAGTSASQLSWEELKYQVETQDKMSNRHLFLDVSLLSKLHVTETKH